MELAGREDSPASRPQSGRGGVNEMAATLGKTIHLTWYAIQGGVLALLSVCGLLFLAGRIGLIQPFSAYVILSGSMAPTIPVGSVVISRKQLSYTTGDVITFGQGKSSVTHRIASMEESSTFYGDATFTTKGDANKTPDGSPVSQANVAGKVLITIPYLGYIVEYAKSPKGFLALIIIPATIIIYEELKNVRKELSHALQRLIKKREEDAMPARFPKAAVVPVVAAAFLFIGAAGAYFLDAEASLGNILGAAISFGEKTATIYDSDPYTCPDGASNTTTSFGTVVLKKNGSNLSVDVQLTGATANSSYDLWVNQDPGACPLGSPTVVAAFTTDGSGNAIFHHDTPLVGSATKFWISAVGGGQVLRSVAVSL